ncbi:MAG: gliding motility-associated C-terminal domain-containing protein [Cytophagales bacterium]|nr:gliding motility-associated C-terminal domain-containing protein [Cytophagales bacterium]
MSKFYRKGVLILSIILLAGVKQVNATHIRAGEIIVERISTQSLTFRITIIGYTDTGSTVEFGGGRLEFGDGTVIDIDTEKDFSLKEDLGDEIALNVFVISHTYQAPGNYTLRFQEFNRNGGILNMANSVETPFYVETNITIDPFVGLNNSPQLLIPPIDRAATGATFFHNPGAFDPDGDSLSYTIVIPKQDIDLEVNAYTFPNNIIHYTGFNYQTANEAQTGPPTYTLNEVNGDLIWDAPGLAGEYNVAFRVEEWRRVGGQWQRLGYVTRDMQIIVEETDNERPELIIPNDTCVVAGTLLDATIIGEDPDDHDIVLETFGGVYDLVSSPATFSPNPPTVQNSPGQLDFSWQTNCTHIRERPYEIQFKVKDNPPPLNRPALATFETWNVTVIAPAPEGLTATVRPGREIQLNWDNYLCNNAIEMRIYRRVDSFQYVPEHCETGIPGNGGYELIGSVDIGNRSFLDDNDGRGLNPGANYCYRLVAVFPLPGGGESIVSEEVCMLLEADAPIITNVSIENTGVDDGEVFIRWTRPFDVDPALFPPPYRYEVARAQGFNGNGGLEVLGSTTDTTFTDTGINTRDQVFNYRIYLYDNANTLVDSSATASTVRLDLQSFLGGVELNWQADVPWSNNIQDFPYHYIYRDRVLGNNPGQLVLIDSVNVNERGFMYLDDGSFNNIPLSDQIEYCYFVTTQGGYGNDLIPEPLINNSQVVCAQPNDTIPPCTPVNITLLDCDDFLRNRPCANDEYANTISWQADLSDGCQSDVRSYNIYFSPVPDGDYVLIGNVIDTVFIHDSDNNIFGLTSLGGCYQLASVDRSGNESVRTDPICVANFETCAFYELPNVFTPNGDGKNDTFQAFKGIPERCPRFVEQVVFTIYNRHGRKLFEYESGGENDIFINWDGNSDSGQQLSSGIYYYEADVTFDILDPNFSTRKLNGWIHLVR